MSQFKEKLWNWGHLEGSHNRCVGASCSMTPEQFAREYGIPNAFIVSYGGNILPPYNSLARRFSGLREIKWSVLGDASTPLPEHPLGNTLDVCDIAGLTDHLTGGIMDDFFSPKRLHRFPPEILSQIRHTLNSLGLDFWCVLYENQLELDIGSHLDCFDGITFWIWESDHIRQLEEFLPRLRTLAKSKPLMLGIYLWDYAGEKELDSGLFIHQLNRYGDLLQNGYIEGIIFCSGAIGDLELETNRILKQWVADRGEAELPKERL